MIFVLCACAGMCALCCAFVFRPLQGAKRFYAASFLCAVAALGLYLALGRPDLPAQPLRQTSESARLMQQETAFMAALQKKPDDADAMIRLAALRLLQGRFGDETTRLLDRAEILKPDDRRITVIRSMIASPNPGTQ